jgi:hypothetical protein
MHVLQYIAVVAEDSDEAMSIVESRLEEELNPGLSWYDWFVIGGGRFVAGDPYESSPNHIISAYEAGNDVFVKTINDCIESRLREYRDYQASLEKSEIDIKAKLDSYTGVMDYSFELYPLAKMIDMLQGQWDYNAYYYDIDSYSTNPKYMLDKIEKDNKNIFLVPVDFHF